VGDALIVYILVSGALGLPRSLLSVAIFGLGYLGTGGASGSGIFSNTSNHNILWGIFFIIAIINTYGMVVNFKKIKLALIAKKNDMK